MKITVSNKDLLMIEREIESFQGSVLGIWFRSKIAEFYSRNQIRLNTLKQKRTDIQNEFLVIEDGKIKTEGEGKDLKLVLKEEIRRKEFEDKMNELMDKIIETEI